MLRNLSQTLTKHMNGKSSSFPQVLRTCVSSGDIRAAINDPMATFKVPHNREFDLSEHIATGEEAAQFAWNATDQWGAGYDDDRWDKLDSLDGVDLQVSKESLLEYSASLHQSTITQDKAGGRRGLE